MIDLIKSLAICDHATEGPWFGGDEHEFKATLCAEVDGRVTTIGEFKGTMFGELQSHKMRANRHFVIEARENYADLILWAMRIVSRLRRELDIERRYLGGNMDAALHRRIAELESLLSEVS
jgi:hypothetical protein